MSDSDFDHNHNGDQDPWNNGTENPSADEQPAEPEQQAGQQPQDTPDSSGQAEAQQDRDVSSSSAPGEDQQGAPYGQPPYQNPQNPYPPYGQYNNPYGQYHQPYGNNSNPYGDYNQNQYNQQYWSYQPYGGQYQQNPNENPQQPKPPKRKITGLRVFLWVLGGLCAAFVLGFCIYGVQTAVTQQGGWPQTTVSQPENGNNDSASSGSESSQAQIQGGVKGDGTNPASSGITIQPKPTTGELNAKDVYKNVVESVVGVETTVAGTTESQGGVIQGTGIVATKDGYILTNAHVVNYSRANKVKVVLHNKKEYEATVVGYDKTSDIAVLKINANDLSPAVFGNAAQLEIGDSVIAIGNPGGMEYSSSLTGGYVSALNRTIESHSDNGMTYIQTDAAINPGNSGGPLVNIYGQVIGINSSKIVATGYEGLGFSIPINVAQPVISDLKQYGYVKDRAMLGISGQFIDSMTSRFYNLPVGMYVNSVTNPAVTSAGIKKGDVITKIDGKAVTSQNVITGVITTKKPGNTVTLNVTSSLTGESFTATVKLAQSTGK